MAAQMTSLGVMAASSAFTAQPAVAAAATATVLQQSSRKQSQQNLRVMAEQVEKAAPQPAAASYRRVLCGSKAAATLAEAGCWQQKLWIYCSGFMQLATPMRPCHTAGSRSGPQRRSWQQMLLALHPLSCSESAAFSL